MSLLSPHSQMVAANQGSGRSLTDAQVASALEALVKGNNAASGKGSTPAASSRRRLMSTTTTISPTQQFVNLRNGAYQLLVTQASSAVLDGQVVVSGSQEVCVGPGLQSYTILSTTSVSYSCAGITKPATVG